MLEREEVLSSKFATPVSSPSSSSSPSSFFSFSPSTTSPGVPSTKWLSDMRDVDGTTSHARRDPSGSLVITQSTMLRQVWFPLLRDADLDVSYYIWALQIYITSLSAAGVAAEPSVTVLLARALCRQHRYAELIQLIHCRLLPDSRKLGFEVLATSIIRENDRKTPNRLRELGLLQNHGIEMLWKSEVITVS